MLAEEQHPQPFVLFGCRNAEMRIRCVGPLPLLIGGKREELARSRGIDKSGVFLSFRICLRHPGGGGVDGHRKSRSVERYLFPLEARTNPLLSNKLKFLNMVVAYVPTPLQPSYHPKYMYSQCRVVWLQLPCRQPCMVVVFFTESHSEPGERCDSDFGRERNLDPSHQNVHMGSCSCISGCQLGLWHDDWART